jgi:hypothetical protein
MTERVGQTFASPDKAEGTGRPNHLLIRDYAEISGGTFRVETDVRLTTEQFDALRSLLEQPDPNKKAIVDFLHKEVDAQDTPGKDKESAKRMFSAAFDLTA